MNEGKENGHLARSIGLFALIVYGVGDMIGAGIYGTIGVAASIVLASTTSVPHVLQGMERLHVPRQLVAITGFMIRYGDVIGGWPFSFRWWPPCLPVFRTHRWPLATRGRPALRLSPNVRLAGNFFPMLSAWQWPAQD